MEILKETELEVEGKGQFNQYNAMINDAFESGREDYANQIRYAMAIGYHAKQEEAQNKIMFLGGIGVLGNLVSHLGTGIVSRWRGTKDLDLIVKDRNYLFVVENAFDELDVNSKSLSIPNKLTVRGLSYDLKESRLGAATADVYVPRGKPSDGISIHNAIINETDWSESNSPQFYGIDVPVIGVKPLLNMKLAVTDSKNVPRRQDQQDIVHLLALAERENISPEQLRFSLSYIQRERLGFVINHIYAHRNISNLGNLIECSDSYREGLIK